VIVSSRSTGEYPPCGGTSTRHGQSATTQISSMVLWHKTSAARTEEYSETNNEEVLTMHNRNRWRTLTQPKEDDGVENEGRRPIKDIPKVVYAPELPKDPYGSTNKPPYVPNARQSYGDDYDHC